MEKEKEKERKTEKELERVIKKKESNFVGRKTWKFYSGGAVRKREMLLAASKVKISGSEKIKANMNTGNKIFGMHVRQFLHKNNV